MKNNLSTTFLALTGLCVFALASLAGDTVSVADEPAANPAEQSLVSAVLQDEIDELPEDNTAYFTASREVQLQLDLLAATSSVGDLDNVMVSVIRPNGKTTRVTPDASGKVTIDDAQPGPHAIVASGEGVHGSTLYYFDEKQEPADALDSGLVAQAPIKRLTMLQIDADRLRPSIDRIRPYAKSASGAGAGSGYDVSENFGVGNSFNYSVTLGPDGTLSGRVISLIKDIPTQGTQVTIFYAGQQVGSTVAGPGGSFRIKGLRGGVHGVVASGRAGYAAFAFEAKQVSELAEYQPIFQQTFVSVMQGDEQLPVVLIPPTMTQSVIEEIEERYPWLRDSVGPQGVDAPITGLDGFTGGPFGPPSAGFSPGAGGAGSGGGGGGFSGGGGGGFGGGGIGGLLGIAAIAAVIESNNNNNNNNFPIVPVTPASGSAR